MGPPIFIGGKHDVIYIGDIWKACFNGAADFYRRKVKQTTDKSGVYFCFNGAADFYRRKGRGGRVVESSGLASMGPPIFIGGKGTPREGKGRESHGFNGAADFYRRKAIYWAIAQRNNAKLQWGRRFLSAESGPLKFMMKSKNTASMGPPIFIGGKRRLSGQLMGLSEASMGPPIFIGGKTD